jgi:hypothetical protein
MLRTASSNFWPFTEHACPRILVNNTRQTGTC